MKPKMKKPPLPQHVDDFIDDYKDDKYARWMLNYFRLPASLKHDFEQFMTEHELYCTWEGKRYRVTGCSATFGDIWLRADFKKDFGYDHRVPVADCTEWGAMADAGALSAFERRTKMLRRASNVETLAMWLGEEPLGDHTFSGARDMGLEQLTSTTWSITLNESGVGEAFTVEDAVDVDAALEAGADYVRHLAKGMKDGSDEP